jgi:signal transduction histidine kinase
MMRGVFLKILLWFWLSLVLVAVALELTITATTTPFEERVHRFSDNALTGQAREAVVLLDRGGAPSVDRFFADLKHRTGIRAVLLNASVSEIGGRPLGPTATVVATRALESGQTEMEADGQTAVKARAVTTADGRRYVLVATMPIGLLRLLYDGPSAQLLRLLAVLLTAAAACYGLARYVARPLATLRAATHELAQGNLAVRVAPGMGTRTDEFAELGRDFDAMAERLEGLMSSERRLLRDISHELRSPLARLSVALGLARQRPAGDSAALDRIEREADRLNALIGQLLTLARLESGAREPAREIVEVLAIVREVAEDADFEARGRRRAVRIVEAADAAVVGDAELLRSAVENVVRNAVRHTADGTAVEIVVRRLHDHGASAVRISVRDHGGGVPHRALPYIFEPFYRVSEAREHSAGGVGLGLTIAHRTVRLHGGTVSAANAPDGGLVVEIDLPAQTVISRRMPLVARV